MSDLVLTPAEREMILKARESAKYEEAYKRGLAAAYNMCINWADQCGGGSGKDGEGYRNLANAILRIDPKKGY